MLATVLVVVAALAVLWSVGSVVLRALAWFLVGVMCLSLVAGIDVPTGAVVAAVAFWLGGHVIHRLRHGYWSSSVLDAMSRRRSVARGGG